MTVACLGIIQSNTFFLWISFSGNRAVNWQSTSSARGKLCYAAPTQNWQSSHSLSFLDSLSGRSPSARLGLSHSYLIPKFAIFQNCIYKSSNSPSCLYQSMTFTRGEIWKNIACESTALNALACFLLRMCKTWAWWSAASSACYCLSCYQSIQYFFPVKKRRKDTDNHKPDVQPDICHLTKT